MDGPTFREVVRILLKRHRPRNGAAKLRPFEALVSIIVSQNSTDLVTERVMADLASRVRVDPPTVAAMRAGDLVRILRPAGLARPQVPKIRETDRHLARRVGRWRLSHGRAYAEINEDLRRYVPPEVDQREMPLPAAPVRGVPG